MSDNKRKSPEEIPEEVTSSNKRQETEPSDKFNFLELIEQEEKLVETKIEIREKMSKNIFQCARQQYECLKFHKEKVESVLCWFRILNVKTISSNISVDITEFQFFDTNGAKDNFSVVFDGGRMSLFVHMMNVGQVYLFDHNKLRTESLPFIEFDSDFTTYYFIIKLMEIINCLRLVYEKVENIIEDKIDMSDFEHFYKHFHKDCLMFL